MKSKKTKSGKFKNFNQIESEKLKKKKMRIFGPKSYHFGIINTKNFKFTRLINLGCDITMQGKTKKSNIRTENQQEVFPIFDINNFQDEVVSYFHQQEQQQQQSIKKIFEYYTVQNSTDNNRYTLENVFKSDLFLSKINQIDIEKKHFIRYDDCINVVKDNNNPFRRLDINNYLTKSKNTGSLTINEKYINRRSTITFFNINYLLNNFLKKIVLQDDIKALKYGNICSVSGGISEAIVNIISNIIAKEQDMPSVHAFVLNNTKRIYKKKMYMDEWWNFYITYADICREETKEDYSNKIGGKYQLDFILADVEENIKEFPNLKSIVAQSRLGLDNLKEGGTFILKLVDIHLRFSVDLIHLLSFCFDRIGLVKLHTSCPSDSERHLFCLNFKKDEFANSVSNYLKNIELNMSTNFNLISIDYSTMFDTSYVKWITKHLEMFDNNQLKSLRKLHGHCIQFKMSMKSALTSKTRYPFPKKWLLPI